MAVEQITSLEEYLRTYRESLENPEAFWERQAQTFHWQKQWDKTLEWNFDHPNIQWFQGGLLNITENCLDRHLHNRGDQTALLWEPNEPGDPPQKITYRQLHEKVCNFANVLKNNGVQKGDRVCIYMPMVPELAIGVLACARIGAIHSVVFAGFSASALADRIEDAQAKVVLTSDGNYRGQKTADVKAVVDEACQKASCIQRCIVVQRTGQDITMQEGRDRWWHQETAKVGNECPAETLQAEDLLFILYTSGSTGKPKGVVHTCGGYMVYAEYTFRNVFQYRDGEVYWCTADVGWITGHTYLIYGPLLSGATTLMFEGVPTYPDPGRFWEIVDKHQVNIFYTAPTAIRALQAQGSEWPEKYQLNSLRVLGTVGEPINEEAWHWYHDHIGQKACPIVDTWWQTENGGITISPLAGITPTKAGFATWPLPGIQPVLVDNEGWELNGNNQQGNLCIKFPWPGMLRTTYGDHERCRNTYFAPFAGYYFSGDGARRDEEGYYRIMGRVDDVINVSGHRFGTAEIENAINEHPNVAESAVVGFPHDLKGQGIYAFVICDQHGRATAEDTLSEIREEVKKIIGAIAKPDKIQLVNGLPKTRSGKIMRRILRKIAAGETDQLGDVSTLLNPEVVEEIIAGTHVAVKQN